jgi:hypothetical protein
VIFESETGSEGQGGRAAGRLHDRIDRGAGKGRLQPFHWEPVVVLERSLSDFEIKRFQKRTL